MGFVSTAVPFVAIGNRRGLTAEQVCQDASLAEFVASFPSNFEFDDNRFVFMFVEPHDADQGSAP